MNMPDDGQALGLTAEDVAKLIDDAVARENDAENDRTTLLVERLDSIGDGVALLAQGAQGAEDDSAGAEGASVVALSDDQWQEMRESWLWAKSSAQTALFLALLVTLLVAAIFGNRLWDAMAKGWRR